MKYMFKKEYITENPKTTFFILACLINIEFLLGPFAPTRIDDRFDIGLIAMKGVGHNLLKYGIHAWDPSAIAGVVTSGSAGFSMFHPAVILAGFLPLWLVYFLWNIFAAFGAGYGMYLYSTKVLKLSLLSSFLGSLLLLATTLQYEGFVATLSYSFPLYLYCFERCVNDMGISSKWKYLLILVIIFISTLPHMTIPFFPVVHLAMILFLVRQANMLKKYLIWFLLIWLIYIIVQAPTLYLLFSEAQYSHRMEFQRYWLNTYYIGQYAVDNILKPALNPTLFTLLPTTLLIISAFFVRNRIVRFWWGYCFILMLVLSITESAFGMNLYKYFGLLKPTRFSLLIPFAFCLLSSYGIFFLEQIYKNEAPEGMFFRTLKSGFILKRIFPAIILFLIALSTYLFFKNPTVIWGIIILCFLYFPLSMIFMYYFVTPRFKKNRDWREGIALLLLLLFTLAAFRAEFTLKYTLIPYNFYFHNPTAEKIKSEFDKSPESPFRAAVLGWQGPYFLQYHGLQTLDGNIGVYPVRFKHYWEKVIEPWLCKADKINTDYFLYYGPKVYLCHTKEAFIEKDDLSYYRPQANLSLLALGNVKYIFSPAPIDNPETYNLSPYLPDGEGEKEYIKFFNLKKRVYSLKNSFSFHALRELFSYILKEHPGFHMLHVVYVLNNTLPRAFMVNDWNIYETESNALSALSRMSVDEISRKAVLIEKEILKEELPMPWSDLQWSAKVVSYKPDYIKVAASANKDAILILTDNFHRNWRAFVNGRPVNIFPVYGTFRGVVVPGGNSTVEFKYHDKVLMCLYFISLMGLIAIIVLAILPRGLFQRA